MGRITLGQFKQKVEGVDPDDKARLGSTDRELKTAKRGFLGRAVRALFGPTKQDRADNKKIMGDLLKSLQDKYGKEVGAQAFLRARPNAYAEGETIYADVGKPLTARQIRTAVAEAKNLHRQNRATNLEAVRDHSAPDPSDEPEPGFAELARTLNINPSELSPLQRQEYNLRLQENVASESQLHRQPLSQDRVAEIAKATMKQVLKLSKAGRLERAPQARAAYTRAVKNFVDGLAANKDEGELLRLLADANRRLSEHAEAEMIDELGGGEVGELTDLALVRARADISKVDLARAQANALGDDAPLRAISAATQKVQSTDGFKSGAEDRFLFVGRLYSIANFVVNGFANLAGPRGDSSGNDLERLSDGEVSAGALQAASENLSELLPPFRTNQI